jgi:hypothetical protein
MPTEEMTMLRLLTLCLVATALGAASVAAHHGWGSYDASKPITVEGPITSSKFENPHALIAVKGKDKVWNVVLAPTTRMVSRGAPAAFIAVGKTVSAYGYASTREQDEMRAERITIDGKTVEMR